jgi:hypothetical protein
MKHPVTSFLSGSHIPLNTLFYNTSKLRFTSRELIMASSTSQHGGLVVICPKARCIFSRSQQMAHEMLLASGLSVFKEVVWILCSHSQFVLNGAGNLKQFSLFKDTKRFNFSHPSPKARCSVQAPPDLAFRHSHLPTHVCSSWIRHTQWAEAISEQGKSGFWLQEGLWTANGRENTRQKVILEIIWSR